MKRIFAVGCAVMMTALLLCGCNENDNNSMSDDLATIASEVRENVDSMIDNGTVSDGDGYIGDNRSTDRATERSTEPADSVPDDGDLIDGEDPTDASAFI